MAMGSKRTELYFVFMNYDPEYHRLQADRTKKGAHELGSYLSMKHDEVLATTLPAGSFKKTLPLVIVDGFAVEITEAQLSFFHNCSVVW
ncbi:putative Leucine-rich repeat protein kinase family protein [Hibiscus syriacus]|uniref:Leucine-rich repeat protein kinase family protein n=1 Tax=Hibiscus syriacus TaxID=106335 RepID=A0A6A2WFD0_HIBSY|nr:putative Leucine-rich repeat protein kinase family protein [Hibiscus syriacus]